LTGPSVRLDPRINAFRDDLADIRLSAAVLAPHYARHLIRGCGVRPTPVRGGESENSAVLSQLLPGEDFAVLEYAGGWAWGYCLIDGVVGYVEAIALAEPIVPTHIVCEAEAPISADDRVTSPLLASLPMGARLQGEEHGACLTTEYGCVSLAHLRRIDDHESDPVTVAERLLGAPWMAGGRTSEGIDAGGLVQLALGLCGHAVPRFPDLLTALGEPATEARRGDLVLDDGLAGLMVDDLMMIHASASTGKVTVEPAPKQSVRRRLPL